MKILFPSETSTAANKNLPAFHQATWVWIKAICDSVVMPEVCSSALPMFYICVILFISKRYLKNICHLKNICLSTIKPCTVVEITKTHLIRKVKQKSLTTNHQCLIPFILYNTNVYICVHVFLIFSANGVIKINPIMQTTCRQKLKLVFQPLRRIARSWDRFLSKRCMFKECQKLILGSKRKASEIIIILLVVIENNEKWDLGNTLLLPTRTIIRDK